MQIKLALHLEQLAVESFETSPQVVSAPEHLTTCMETDCGRFRCCA